MSTPLRPEVESFMLLAPLPDSNNADEATVQQLSVALENIRPPVSSAEAIRLSTAFGTDECFGLAWTLLHLIESSPGGVPPEALLPSDNEWIALLRERSLRG